MPTYDYQCNECSHSFEAFHAMSAAALTQCPKCGAQALERKIGLGAGIVFKGSGFYGTDYKKSAPTNTTSSESASSTPAPAPAATEAPKAKPCGKSACGCH